MIKLLQEDLHRVMLRLPKDVAQLMKDHNLMLGGGFIREIVNGLPPNDIDLLGPTKDRLKLAATELWHKRKSEARVLETDNAITHVAPPRTTVQFITRWLFDDPKELIKSFDFTVCQAVVAWVPGTESTNGYWDSIVSDRFYADLASKRLKYTSPDRHEDAGGSMLRMRKFLGRGYHISADDLAAVMARVVSKVNFEALPYETDAMTQEQAVTVAINGLLREVDPLLVIDGVEPVDTQHEAR